MKEEGKKKESKFGSYFTHFEFLYKDKELSFFEVSLLNKITSLLSNNLPCSATNRYFAKSFNTSESYVRKALQHIVDLGYLERETVTKKDHLGRFSTKRILKIAGSNEIDGGYYSIRGGDTIVSLYNIIYNRAYNKLYAQRELKKIPSGKKTRKPLVFKSKEKEKKKHLPIDKASPDAVMIIKRWNKYSCGVEHKKFDTKVVQKTLHHLDNKVLPKYSLKRVLKTMRDYVYMVNNPQSFKVSRKKINVYSFFVISKFMRKNKKRNGDRLVSYFDRIIKSKDLQEFSTMKDNYPNTTRRLKNFYRKHVLVEDEVEYTHKQEGQFIRAAEMLHKYMEKGRLEKFIENANINTYVRVLFQALSAKWKDDLGVHNLCSKFTYSDTLPKYISEEFEN